MSKNNFLEEFPHLEDFSKLLPELNKESDRGAVLIVCSYLDELLKNIILSHLLNNEKSEKLVTGFHAPLGSLSTRTTAAYALGLINQLEYNECNILRKLRNQFAHTVHISFKDQSLINLCNNLSMSAKDIDNKVKARGLFTTAAVSLILNLTNRPHYVSKNRCEEKKWSY